MGAGGCGFLVAGVLVLSRGHAPGLSLSGRAQVTLDPGLEIEPALSPDGKLIAYVAGPLNVMKVYVGQLEGGAPILVVRDVGGWQRAPSRSTDGRRLLHSAH